MEIVSAGSLTTIQISSYRSNVKRSVTGIRRRLDIFSRVSKEGALIPRSIRLRKSTEMSNDSANAPESSGARLESAVDDAQTSFAAWPLGGYFQAEVSRSMVTSTTEWDYGSRLRPVEVGPCYGLLRLRGIVMRALICVLLVALAIPASAQAPAPNSISIGKVRLLLGAPKESVLGSLRKDYDVWELGDHFVIGPKGHSHSVDASVEGFVSFRDDRLSSVTRPWNLRGSDTGNALVGAILGAFTTFGESATACSVSTFDNQEPTIEKKGVAVSCGQKSVVIFTSRVVFGSKSVDMPLVNEVLGEP